MRGALEHLHKCSSMFRGVEGELVSRNRSGNTEGEETEEEHEESHGMHGERY